MAAGFRESGIGSNNLVGIRISLKLDAPIAKLDPETRRIVPLVSNEFVVNHLDTMMRDRFRENFRRRDVLHRGITRDFFNNSSSSTNIDTSSEVTPKRFGHLAQNGVATVTSAPAEKEDKEARRERKRREGLLKQADRQKEKAAARLLKQQQQEQE